MLKFLVHFTSEQIILDSYDMYTLTNPILCFGKQEQFANRKDTIPQKQTITNISPENRYIVGR